jgi:hypothetical protein
MTSYITLDEIKSNLKMIYIPLSTGQYVFMERKRRKKYKQETIYYLLATSLFYIFVYHNYIKSFHSDCQCQIKGLHMAIRCCQMQFQRYLAS